MPPPPRRRRRRPPQVLITRESALKALLTCHTSLIRATQPLRDCLAQGGGAAPAAPKGGAPACIGGGAEGGAPAAAAAREPAAARSVALGPLPGSALAAAASVLGADAAAAAAAAVPGWAKVLDAMIEEEGAAALLARFSNYPREDTGRLARTYTEEVAAPLFRRAPALALRLRALAAPPGAAHGAAEHASPRGAFFIPHARPPRPAPRARPTSGFGAARKRRPRPPTASGCAR